MRSCSTARIAASLATAATGATLLFLAVSCSSRKLEPDEVMVLVPESSRFGSGGGFYVDFVEDIKPILESRCLHCHHARSPWTSLSFESFEDVHASNQDYQLIIPGEPERSSIFLVTVIPEHFAESMPADGHRLDKGDAWLIYQWIAQGAEWPRDKSGKLKRQPLPEIERDEDPGQDEEPRPQIPLHKITRFDSGGPGKATI